MPSERDLIRQYCDDVLELQRHIIRMTDDQTKQEDVQRYGQVMDIVNMVRDTIGRQSAAMQQHLTTLGGDSGSMLRQAISGLVEMATGMVVRGEGTENVSKVLRNNFVALEMAGVGYLMLYATALAVGDHDTAGLMRQQLSDVRPLARQVKDLIPEIVGQELSNEGYQVERSAVAEAAQLV